MMQPQNMYELQKYVLQNVIGNELLFRKELLKSYKFLDEIEFANLSSWLSQEHDISVQEYINEPAN